MRTRVIYEDDYIIVAHKPAGLATQTAKLGQQDLVSEIKNYLSGESKQEPYIGLIHRLDQPVEGILVLAKNEFAAAKLSTQITEDKMKKCYYALAYGKPKQTEGVLENYLLKDRKTNLSKVVPKNIGIRDVKYARLWYQCINTVDKLPDIEEESVQLAVSLLDIQLKTGRHHQIRVQLAYAGYPLLGDYKYGTEESMNVSKKIKLNNVALCAYRLDFMHPKTGKQMHMEITPEAEIFKNISKNQSIKG